MRGWGVSMLCTNSHTKKLKLVTRQERLFFPDAEKRVCIFCCTKQFLQFNPPFPLLYEDFKQRPMVLLRILDASTWNEGTGEALFCLSNILDKCEVNFFAPPPPPLKNNANLSAMKRRRGWSTQASKMFLYPNVIHVTHSCCNFTFLNNNEKVF